MRNQIYCALQMRLQKVCQSHTEIIFQACTYYCPRFNSIWSMYYHRLIHYMHVILHCNSYHLWTAPCPRVMNTMHFLQLLSALHQHTKVKHNNSNVQSLPITITVMYINLNVTFNEPLCNIIYSITPHIIAN